jgi:hypothetical protein
VELDTPLALDLATPEDLAARRAAEQARVPFLLYRDDHAVQRIVALGDRDAALTLGRRLEAHVSLPWDPEVSRLHAEVECKAGEWILTDDGYSQNGTFVNGLRIHGRRRLRDGDLVRVGRTTLAYCDPTDEGTGATLAPGELGAAPAFSEQQQALLLGLCRPLLGDGEGLLPASDEAVSAACGVPLDVVVGELDQLGRMFGFDDLPVPDRRAETALLALRAGLVSPDDREG